MIGGAAIATVIGMTFTESSFSTAADRGVDLSGNRATVVVTEPAVLFPIELTRAEQALVPRADTWPRAGKCSHVLCLREARNSLGPANR